MVKIQSVKCETSFNPGTVPDAQSQIINDETLFDRSLSDSDFSLYDFHL